MKVLRLAAILLLIPVLLIGAAAIAIITNQARIMHLVLQGVKDRTGFQVTARATHIHLSNHLILEFDEPHVSHDGQELVRLQSLRAVVSYHSLIFAGGVPLYSLVLVHPQFQVPAKAVTTPEAPFPRIGTEMVATILKVLQGLERGAWRIETVDATVNGPDGNAMFDQLGMLAFRRHRESQLWMAGFSVRVLQYPFEGMHLTGKIRVGPATHIPEHEIAGVSLWFWNDGASTLALGPAIHLEGKVSGSGRMSLADNGCATGSCKLNVLDSTLSAKGLNPERLGDFSVKAEFSESADSMSVTNLKLIREQTVLASGSGDVHGLSVDKPVLTANLNAGVPLDVATLRSHLGYLKGVPGNVIAVVNQIKTGSLLISNASLAAPLDKFEADPVVVLRDNIDISAILKEVSFALPDDLKLPPVDHLNAQLRFARNTMSATQGSATVDQSAISDVAMRLDFAKRFDSIAYQLVFKGDASLGQLYPAITHAMETYKVAVGKQIEGLGGRVSMNASASGAFKIAQPVVPKTYRVSFEANRATLTAKNTPGTIEFARGSIVIEPGTIRFNRFALRTTGGTGIVDGTLGFGASGVRVRDVTIELHQMPAGLWLALAIDPDSLKLEGPLGGKVRVRADPARADGLIANGKFVVNSGSFKFSFLRAPIVVQGATLSLDGHSLTVAMPSSTLEGSPIDFRMSVADLGHPRLRIDAKVQRLDFECMRFIRLPWTPAAPPMVFPIPVEGHVEVEQGNLSKLPMSKIKTDFWRVNGDWKVYNYTMTLFNGSAELELTGRAKDDWIRMQGKLVNADIAPMFLLSGERKESPIVGKMWIATDLWADTNNDFFDTLSGTTAITVRDGLLNRFKLLSRMLALIDLKSWLTANFPDPTIAGLPFQTIFFDLKGKDGVFWTDNFLLQGPVMDITANGNISFAQSTLDMRLAAFPLTSFNWLVSKIPIIGDNVAGGTGNIVAAYFHAHGPISDPSVSPMPITSVTEIVKKFLGMPINIIRPNTIK
ncbi:MAG: AsmA-like C-terminal domain-containing protein [Candidatus Binataceae bacterium]